MLAMGHAPTPMLAAACMDGAIMTTVLPHVEMGLLAMGIVKTPLIAAFLGIVMIATMMMATMMMVLRPPPPPRTPQLPASHQPLPNQA